MNDSITAGNGLINSSNTTNVEDVWAILREKGKQEGKGMRFNEGKVRWGLVDWKSVEPMVRVLEFGARKYDDNNWKKGLDKRQILESMMRHLAALMDGERNDGESGISHIGHIMCNCMFYNYFDREHDEKG